MYQAVTRVKPAYKFLQGLQGSGNHDKVYRRPLDAMFIIAIEIYIVFFYRLRHWVNLAPVTDFAISQNPPLLAVNYNFLSF